MELPINKYYIDEIKYKLNDEKTVVFKMRNFMLKDVEIIENVKKENFENNNAGNEKLAKPKELHDYKPLSCLEGEKGMQETLEASRELKWKENIMANDKTIKQIVYNSLDEKYANATSEEKTDVSREIIKKMAKEDAKIIKERSNDRTKEEYFTSDPNDEYSKIKSLSDVDGKPFEIKIEEKQLK